MHHLNRAAARQVLLAIAAISSLAAPGHPAFGGEEPATPAAAVDLLGEEDRIDALAPAQQVDEYLRLRRMLLARGGAEAQVTLARLAMKLDLANARSQSADPDYARRLSFCRQASEIGETYLKQGDPGRALGWERMCDRIEPGNQYASVLRNQVNQWFEHGLNRHIVEADWQKARETLAQWRGLLGADRMVDEGVATYARARARHLGSALRAAGPASALRALGEEEERYPGLDAWTAFRSEVADSLQQPFDRSIAERRVAEAKAALARQAEIAKAFGLDDTLAPIDANRTRLAELVNALAPAPLQRPYGHVCYPVFRLEVSTGSGEVEISDRGERVKDAQWAPAASLVWRQRRDDRPRWQGADLSVLTFSAEGGRSSSTVVATSADWLIGTRGEQWSAWTGLGVVFATIDFTGLAVADVGEGYAIGNVRAGAERALGESFSVYCDAEAAASAELSQWQLRLGARYYASRNFAVGAQVLVARLTADDEDTPADVTGTISSAGVGVLVQF